MLVWEYTFFICCFIILYNYAGYAVLAAVLNALSRRPRKSPAPGHKPLVSFIVAAYNEESGIRDKVLNSIGQDYPADKLDLIFVTDGSTDHTPDIIREFPSVRLLHEPRRQGKSNAVNRAVRAANGEVLIFSDANTNLNKEAVKRIAAHYCDRQVGGVAGEKKVLSHGATDASGQGEGLYWKYESGLKKIDSDFYSVVGAAGELFSLRKELYEPLPENTILDDFVLSLRVAEQGYRVVYEPGAFAAELPSFSAAEEQKRKVRIAAGGFQAMGMLRSLLLFWRHPRLSFLYISHRVLRWTLSPLCLIGAFLSNACLYFSGNQLFKWFFLIQIVFYGLALLSLFRGFRNRRFNKLLTIPYYFAFMNVSVILGFFRFLKGSQSAVWEKARRAEASINTE